MAVYPKQDVFEVACALFRLNGNKVIKADEKNVVNSKTQLQDHFDSKTVVTITEMDRSFADLCVRQLQHRLLLNQLTARNQSDFIDNVTSLSNLDTINAKKFGTVVWIPKVVEGMIAEDQQKVEVAHMSFASKYQGKVGEKLTTNFIPLRVKYVHEYSCFRHFGHDGNGNLIGFLHKTQLEGVITGKIKAHEVSKFNNHGRVTYLNYVKVAK